IGLALDLNHHSQPSVVVENGRVYASHGMENLDSDSRGRIVCFDANGSGDITKTNEIWRYDAIGVGYASPLIHDGRLYVITNAGNLKALDAATGKEFWTFNVGTVGKGSPVWADGKIFATAVNGHFHIIKPGDKAAKSLDSKQIAFDETRAAEIYGSPAIAYQRIYLQPKSGCFAWATRTRRSKPRHRRSSSCRSQRVHRAPRPFTSKLSQR
ncbi:MAG: PQQ-binding-like beta-propeller repeat protein, partial [bacterium]